MLVVSPEEAVIKLVAKFLVLLSQRILKVEPGNALNAGILLPAVLTGPKGGRVGPLALLALWASVL